MDFLLEALTNWLKEMLVGGIMSNLSGMFDSVNQQVADISVQVGQTPQGWNGSIFNMIENLSNSIMVPIAGVILAIVMTLLATAKAFAYMMTELRIPSAISSGLLSITDNKYILLLIINVLLLLLGCVREWMALGTVFGTPVGQRAVLPMAGMPAGGFIVLGVLCAVWRALAARRKAYLVREAHSLVDVHAQKEADGEQ